MSQPQEPDGTWVTTTTILDGLSDRDNRDAWERFAERFRRPVAGFALQMGVAAADCEDVAQETLLAFVEAYRAGKYDRARGRLRSWLFGIAYRQSLAQKRRSARHPHAPAGAEDAVDSRAAQESAARIWEQLWDRFLLERALETVRAAFSPESFRAFELVALQDRAPADAAAELGLPIKSVYNAKHRVAKRMRECIAELESVEPEAAA